MVSSGGVVVIADGDDEARAAAARALGRAGYETVEVTTAGAALEAVREDGVGLLLLEVALPDMTGYEVCREVREARGDELPIFFVSGTRTESMDCVAGLLLGADDFIVKPFEPAELVVRTRRFVKRPSRRREEIARPHFTPREKEILDLLTTGSRQKEIARQLSISPKTVATHIQHLLKKLDVHSRAELVASAHLLGLVQSVARDR